MGEKHTYIGKRGEDLATKHLIAEGYRILENNWRFSKAEIDIIAFDGEVLVFVEVKARSYDYYGKPEESVTQKKQDLMIDASFQYMQKIDHQWEVRFDIISILFNAKVDFELKHFKDVFF